MANFFRAPGQKTLMITGCDTEVGKTVVTSILAAYWQKYYSDQPLALMKLLQTGLGDDEHYQGLFGHIPGWQVVTPLKFASPVAPPIAAMQEGKTVDLSIVWQTLQRLQQSHSRVLVEALGSLGSPVTPELTVADLAAMWNLPTILVVPVKLGALGQAIAQVALARQTKVNLQGLILSCATPEAQEKLQDWADPPLLASFTQLPILAIVPYVDRSARQDLVSLAQIGCGFNIEQFNYFL